MTAREQSVFAAGLAHAADQALIAALALEIRPDARHTRQQAAIAALRGLAEGLKAQASIDAVRCSLADKNSGTGSASALPV